MCAEPQNPSLAAVELVDHFLIKLYDDNLFSSFLGPMSRIPWSFFSFPAFRPCSSGRDTPDVRLLHSGQTGWRHAHGVNMELHDDSAPRTLLARNDRSLQLGIRG